MQKTILQEECGARDSCEVNSVSSWLWSLFHNGHVALQCDIADKPLRTQTYQRLFVQSLYVAQNVALHCFSCHGFRLANIYFQQQQQQKIFFCGQIVKYSVASDCTWELLIVWLTCYKFVLMHLRPPGMSDGALLSGIAELLFDSFLLCTVLFFNLFSSSDDIFYW